MGIEIRIVMTSDKCRVWRAKRQGYGGYCPGRDKSGGLLAVICLCVLYYNSSKFSKEELIPGSPANSNS